MTRRRRIRALITAAVAGAMAFAGTGTAQAASLESGCRSSLSVVTGASGGLRISWAASLPLTVTATSGAHSVAVGPEGGSLSGDESVALEPGTWSVSGTAWGPECSITEAAVVQVREWPADVAQATPGILTPTWPDKPGTIHYRVLRAPGDATEWVAAETGTSISGFCPGEALRVDLRWTDRGGRSVTVTRPVSVSPLAAVPSPSATASTGSVPAEVLLSWTAAPCVDTVRLRHVDAHGVTRTIDLGQVAGSRTLTGLAHGPWTGHLTAVVGGRESAPSVVQADVIAPIVALPPPNGPATESEAPAPPARPTTSRSDVAPPLAAEPQPVALPGATTRPLPSAGPAPSTVGAPEKLSRSHGIAPRHRLALALRATIGGQARGSTVDVSASGLQPGSGYRVHVHSTPRLVGDGIVDADGAVRTTVRLPADLEPGDHRIVFDGTADGGAPVRGEYGFTVDEEGLLLATDDVPLLEKEGEEAVPYLWTGVVISSLLTLMLLALATSVRTRVRRARVLRELESSDARPFGEEVTEGV